RGRRRRLRRRGGAAGVGRPPARGAARVGAGEGTLGEGRAATGAGAAGGPCGAGEDDGEGADGPDRPPLGRADGGDERAGGCALLPGGCVMATTTVPTTIKPEALELAK